MGRSTDERLNDSIFNQPILLSEPVNLTQSCRLDQFGLQLLSTFPRFETGERLFKTLQRLFWFFGFATPTLFFGFILTHQDVTSIALFNFQSAQTFSALYYNMDDFLNITTSFQFSPTFSFRLHSFFIISNFIALQVFMFQFFLIATSFSQSPLLRPIFFCQCLIYHLLNEMSNHVFDFFSISF